jgi:rhamnulokinase
MATIQKEFTYLAIDLGAESGRAILGRLDSGRLSIEEVSRFPNQPVQYNGALHWDAPRLWFEITSALRSLSQHGVSRLDAIGVDTWGVDYALLGENGALIENPFHYRDARTAGVMERVMKTLGRAKIYGITGIQFLPFNTLYQLCAAATETPRTLAQAEHLLTMPDLFNFWLSGKIACEYTNASTTQFLDVRTRQWSRELLGAAGVPTHFLSPIIEPGSVIGAVRPEIAAEPPLSKTVVIAPACHDTGSAFAAVKSGDGVALISSGTWSLLGAEVGKAVVTEDARRLNFTNEGGACGTVRLLKNITGMWLLERCRQVWQTEVAGLSYTDLLAAAGEEKPLRHLLDPDDPAFRLPTNLPEAIAAFCARTGQPTPPTPAACTRAILESLALKYRTVLESLEGLVGTRFQAIRVVGGGSQNDLLNQFTADATGRRVLAGPAEATALGNLAMQMVGTGAVGSLAEAREILAASFTPRIFEPESRHGWEAAYQNFRGMITS